MKKMLPIILSLALTCSLFPIGSYASKVHWAAAELDAFKASGYLKDIYLHRPNKTPDEGLTRAEFTSLLMRSLGIYTNELETVPQSDLSSFPDLKDHWSRPLVIKAANQGLIQGYEDGTFQPERVITRAESAALLTRAFFEEIPNQSSRFIDAKIHWADNYIALAEKLQWVKGMNENHFAPDQKISLAQGVVLFSRIKGQLKDFEIKELNLSSLPIEGHETRLNITAANIPSNGLLAENLIILWKSSDYKVQFRNHMSAVWKPLLPQTVALSAEIWMNRVSISKKQIIVQVQSKSNSDTSDQAKNGVGAILSYPKDTDKDGIPDANEAIYGTDPLNPDTDGDSMTDYIEVYYKKLNLLDPLKHDTDGNGINDEDEDFDKDGLINRYEAAMGTEFNLSDTDNDGLTDLYESKYYSPEALSPINGDSNGNEISDAEEDYDSDKLTNIQEQAYGSDPFKMDSDKDTLTDYFEITQSHTNPIKMDTDNDGLDDDSEIKLGFNPLIVDSDGNNLPDGEEKVTQNTDSLPLSEKLSFTVEIHGTGDVQKNTNVRNSRGDSPEADAIAGLIGSIVSIETESDFDTATLTFQYDPKMIKNPNDLQIVWIKPEEEQIIFLENQVLDEKKHTISAPTTHFSMYAVIDKSVWLKSWSQAPFKESLLESITPVDYAFVIDNSLDMAKGNPLDDRNPIDPNGLRYRAATHYIDQYMNQNDRGAVLDFSGTVEISVPLTTDPSRLKAGIKKMRVGTKAANIAGALNQAIELLDHDKQQGRKKAIVLISNGEDNVNYANRFDDVIASAAVKGVEIYPIGIGKEFIDTALLKKIASKTGGAFSSMSNEKEMKSSLIVLAKRLGNDKDMDGIPDALERYGMIQWNGTIARTSTEMAYVSNTDNVLGYDTDRDTLSDGVEMGFINEKGEPIKPRILGMPVNGMIIRYFSNRSNPIAADSDNDKIGDLVDLHPRIMYTPYVLLLHGVLSNVASAYGAYNAIVNRKDHEYKESLVIPILSIPSILNERDITSRLLSDPKKQKITSYDKDGLYYFLTQQGYKADHIFALNYPNRAYIKDAAITLQDYLNNLYKQEIIEPPTKGGKPKIDIIAHSMGGLVGRYYIEFMDHPVDVNKLISLATPYWGGYGFAHIGGEAKGFIPPMYSNYFRYDASSDSFVTVNNELFKYPNSFVDLDPGNEIYYKFKSIGQNMLTKYFFLIGTIASVNLLAYSPNLNKVEFVYSPEDSSTDYFKEFKQYIKKSYHDTLIDLASSDGFVSINSGLGQSGNTKLLAEEKKMIVNDSDLVGHTVIHHNRQVWNFIIDWLKR